MHTLRLILLFLIPSALPFTVVGQSYAQLVDTRIGTEKRSQENGLACGYNYIGATYPFGMVQFTPSFFSPQKGFTITQLSGAGCSNMGNFPMLAIAGSLKNAPNEMKGFAPFKEVEKANAGFCKVKFPDNTSIAVTANERIGAALISFPNSENEGTIIIGSGVNSTFITDAKINITSPTTCQGFSSGGEFCGTETPYIIYFAAEFNRPALKTGTWAKKKLSKKAQATGEHSGAWFTFDSHEENEVVYKIAISFVSVENAKANLNAGDLGEDFEAYKSNAFEAWNEKLSKIEVQSDDEDALKQFYTHLYHSLIHPNLVSDVDGDYMGADFEVHNSERDHYGSFSVWDTYRTQAQLLAMLYPQKVSDMMQSVVDFAEQAGGFGRWMLANIETGIMQGDPTTILVSNSYAFGARNFELMKAFKHMKQAATIPRLKSQKQEIRPYLDEYIRDGHTFASMSLEYCSADFAAGQFAKQALDDKSEATFFINRSQNWTNNFNSKTKWLCSRFPNGIWKLQIRDWREGSNKNYFWMVPHNLNGLIDSIGGKKQAEIRLDDLFVRLDATYHDNWFMSGNEPDFQAPWIYNWTTAPYKSSETINRILTEMYDSSPSGLPGNDDLGTMGAWYVFASLGIYPMVPGVGGFSISSPQFAEILIDLPSGEMKISGGQKGGYIQSLKIDKKEFRSTWIDWHDFRGAKEFNFETSDNPNKEWGTSVPLPKFENIKK